MSRNNSSFTVAVIFLIVLVIVTAAMYGCSTTVPVARTFPEAPAKLLEPPPELQPIPSNTTELSVLIDNANENYHSFRVLREYYQAWQQWYQEQRDNFNSVK